MRRYPEHVSQERRLMRLGRSVLVVLYLLTASPVFSAENVAGVSSESIAAETKSARELDAIERQLKKPEPSEGMVRQWMGAANRARDLGTSCITEAETELKRLTTDHAKLGEAVRGEPRAVTHKRAELGAQMEALNKRNASCRLLLLRAEELARRLGDLREQLLAMRLLARGPDGYSLIKDNWNQPALWWTVTRDFVIKHSGLDLMSAWHITGLVLLLGMTFGIALLIRRSLNRYISNEMVWGEGFNSRFVRALLSAINHYLLVLLPSLAAAVYFFFLTHESASVPLITPTPFVAVVAYGIPVTLLLMMGVELFLVPRPPVKMVYELPYEAAMAMQQRLKMLVLLVFIGYLLFATILSQRLPEQAFLLARAALVTALVINLMWAAWLLGHFWRFAARWWVHALTQFFLFLIGLAEWLGYRNLVSGTSRAVFGSLFILGVFQLLRTLIGGFYDGLDAGRYPVHRWLRARLGLHPDDVVPGLLWLRAITALVLWAALVAAILPVWGFGWVLNVLLGYLVNGFMVGSLHILPNRIMLAVLSFVFMIMFAGWFKGQLEHRWLKKTRMERGAREATVTITGYLGTAAAVLIGLGVAGFQFTNIAIIAGALSVGIGFGLQNIVNNFVSGLILLFERPIKTGDWVVVGQTEGYVRRIRIRSTQIQTFDRADVIVPNSELVASQVTNWMLRDTRGRLRLPLGVAYGSDTDRVKALLLQAAVNHPEIIHDDPAFPAKVLFMRFGDSALEFELRCFIRNIDNRLNVTSDLNFAIDAACRESGITIPFPQRDIHIHHTDPQSPHKD